MKVFVTGGSNGIGAAIVSRFLDGGYEVTSTFFSSEAGTLSKNCDWHQCDLTKIEDIKACAKLVELIQPDILINNAGMNINSSFEDIDIETFEKIHTINTVAPLALMKASVRGMRNKKFGRIVNIASIWSIVSKEMRASYSSSKFAVDGLTISFAAEYSKFNILANCVSPGFIDTELTARTLGEQGIRDLINRVPSGRLGHVEEVSELVFWLAGSANSFVTGQNIAIDGGFSRT